MQHDMDELSNQAEDTVFRDLVMLALIGFISIVVLLLPHVNIGQDEKSDDAPGSLIIEARWPDGVNIDVDLWVKSPDDRPVGYTNAHGKYFNLLRDDLGTARDVTPLNYEIVFSRGIPAGEYIVNVHLFSRRELLQPVPVQVTASVKHGRGKTTKQLLYREVDLVKLGQEITVFRFMMDGNKQFIRSSVHDLPIIIRSGIK